MLVNISQEMAEMILFIAERAMEATPVKPENPGEAIAALQAAEDVAYFARELLKAMTERDAYHYQDNGSEVL